MQREGVSDLEVMRDESLDIRLLAAEGGEDKRANDATHEDALAFARPFRLPNTRGSYAGCKERGMSDFVASRRFGDAVVTVISAGTQRW